MKNKRTIDQPAGYIILRRAENGFRGARKPAGYGFSFSPKFWSHFVKHYWGKKPLAIEQPFTTPINTTEETFAAFTKASEEVSVNGSYVQYRFFKGEDGFLLHGSRLKGYIPDESDASIDDYAERMRHKLKGEKFGLILNGFQRYDSEFYLRTREFLDGLIVKLPVPCSVKTGAWLGNYDKTPFGIHKDELAVFQFIIMGRRRIYLWPEKYFRDWFDERRELDFELLRKDALSMEGKAGDLLYWPSSYWHVGESFGDLSLSIGLALKPLQLADTVLADLKSRLDECVGSSLRTNGFPRSLRDLKASPRKISQLIRRATNMVGKAEGARDFIRGLQVSSLNQLTSSYHEPVPSPLPAEILSDHDVIRGFPTQPILWISPSVQEIICSANGHAFTVPAAPAIIRLLQRLNSGQALQVSELIGRYQGVSRRNGTDFDVSAKAIRTLLSKLYRLRAVSREGRKGSRQSPGSTKPPSRRRGVARGR